MIIERLELKNFRNYKSLDICLEKGINIFYGNNAQGKTNILESIYMCATASSHRGNKDKEIIKFNEEESHVKAMIKKGSLSYRYDMHLRKNKSKGIAINGLPVKKISEIFGIINVIMFSPEDLSIIKDGPSKRRRFMDIELCQIDKIYLDNLISYNKILNQRNKVLKDYDFIKDANTMMDVLDEQLEIKAFEIIKRREDFIKEINKYVKRIHENITEGKEEINICYNPSIKDINNSFKNNRYNDIRYKTTTIGPHRDDIIFLNGNEDIRSFGSQGQQRTAALSLKLAEIELVKKRINDNPILLLDDVLSELDEKRQNHLMDYLKDVQTLVTCTGVESFINKRSSKDKIFYVENGTVIERIINE